MSEKQELRNIYKTLRNGMSSHDTEPLSARICGHILDSSLYRDAQYIYAYYPLKNEADVRLVAQTAWQEKKRVAFPKVFGEEMRFFEVTDFGQFAEGAFGIMEPLEAAGATAVDWMEGSEEASERAPGCASSSASERAPGCAPTIAYECAPSRAPGTSLLVLVPGIAFDRDGNRMGHGRGYYDRYFAKLAGPLNIRSDVSERVLYNNTQISAINAAARSAVLLGVAYESQIADSLPEEPHDLVVSYLVTEKGIIRTAE